MIAFSETPSGRSLFHRNRDTTPDKPQRAQSLSKRQSYQLTTWRCGYLPLEASAAPIARNWSNLAYIITHPDWPNWLNPLGYATSSHERLLASIS